MSDIAMSSPIRALQDPVPGIPTVLRANEIDYADGAEARVLEHILSATDRTSLSDELESSAQDWIEAYHLGKSRANIVRALDLPETARVLEIGAGCGPITRYLGERCALVDAIEPVPLRARAAAERTRDLSSVRVFVGELDDVPVEKTYDVVLFCGVLEWLGEGVADHGFYVDVLTAARNLLAPSGCVVIAIENQLGVKYLAGAPEDHSGRVFDGIEGYPRGGRARTWSRRELGAICGSAGLTTTFLHAFPDYKMTRVVMSDALMEDSRTGDVAASIPRFPSDSYPAMDAWQLGDERRIWRSLIAAGVGEQHANSFLVIGRSDERDDHAVDLWPQDQLARFFNTRGRIARFTTVASLIRAGDGDIAVNRALLGGDDEPTSGSLTLQPGSEAFIEGVDLTDELRTAAPARRVELLQRWRELVLATHRAMPDGEWLIDAVPRNVRIDTDDELRLIDQEWVWRGDCGIETIMRRGAFLLVLDLMESIPAVDDGLTGRAIAQGLGVDLSLNGDWIDQAIKFEADLQCLVGGVAARDEARRHRELTDALTARMASSLATVQESRTRVPGPVEMDTGNRIDRLTVSERERIDWERERAKLSSELAVLQERFGSASRALAQHEAASARNEELAAALGAEVRELQGRNRDLEAQYHQVLAQFHEAVNSRGWQMVEAARRIKGRIPGR